MFTTIAYVTNMASTSFPECGASSTLAMVLEDCSFVLRERPKLGSGYLYRCKFRPSKLGFISSIDARISFEMEA